MVERPFLGSREGEPLRLVGVEDEVLREQAHPDLGERRRGQGVQSGLLQGLVLMVPGVRGGPPRSVPGAVRVREVEAVHADGSVGVRRCRSHRDLAGDPVERRDGGRGHELPGAFLLGQRAQSIHALSVIEPADRPAPVAAPELGRQLDIDERVAHVRSLQGDLQHPPAGRLADHDPRGRCARRRAVGRDQGGHGLGVRVEQDRRHDLVDLRPEALLGRWVVAQTGRDSQERTDE